MSCIVHRVSCLILDSLVLEPNLIHNNSATKQCDNAYQDSIEISLHLYPVHVMKWNISNIIILAILKFTIYNKIFFYPTAKATRMPAINTAYST